MAGLFLYNSLTREKERFEPIKPGKAGLYTCGPTVYDYAHIGNFRTYVFEDVLRRVLEFNGLEVMQVMNVTDVGHLTSDADTGEDKLEVGAKREKKTVWEIAAFYTDVFMKDMERLNIQEPHVMPRATDHIQEQIDLISMLEKNGYTYETSDGVYFDTSKFSDYGDLARLDIEGLRAGARIDMKEKRNPTDFALWKFTPESGKRAMEWDSPWGKGFPGWHIECSAMSMKYLGETFDIHTGGIDHLPVHHPNEIAQAEGATGKKFVNYWIHGEFMTINGGRMGKSEGNLIRLDELVEKGYDPLDYRYLLLTAHYQTKLNFSWDSLDSARSARSHMEGLLRQMPDTGGKVLEDYESRFSQAVNDNLDTPQALAIAWELLRSDEDPADKKATMLHFDAVFGLRLDQAKELEIPEEIKKLVDEREKAREGGDWEASDKLRHQIEKKGYLIEDTEEGPALKLK